MSEPAAGTVSVDTPEDVDVETTGAMAIFAGVGVMGVAWASGGVSGMLAIGSAAGIGIVIAVGIGSLAAIEGSSILS